jgi:NAD(P)-dependent dehydrogenase (short-subunit alcohol dehydrogenase family)
MDLKLRGAAVLVTGRGRGRGFAEEGADVVICARDRGQLDAADCRRVVDETAASFGRLDVLVNNASTSVDKTPKSQRSKKLGLTEAEVEAAFLKQIPLGRMIESSDVTPLVLFLASPLAGATTGQALVVDGGALRGVNY